jgi:uncharacterized membrane protein YhfC
MRLGASGLGCLMATAAMGVGFSITGLIEPVLGVAVLVQLLAFLSVPLIAGFGLVSRWRLGVGWLAVGALSWLCALPFLAAGTSLGAWLGGSTPLVGAIALSLSAGLFEELSRYGLYRLITRVRGSISGRQAIVLGVAHGGVESLLFGAGTLALVISEGELMQAWEHGLMGASRVLLLLGHVGFTLMVWRAVQKRQLGWLAGAIGLHVAVDLAAFAGPIVWPQLGMLLGGGAVVGLAAWSARLAGQASSAAV